MTKFFISHSSEDKKAFVKPLADTLIMWGVDVFYDEYSIELGDSLFKRINQGITESDCVIIVLSPSFFNKSWPEQELKAVFVKFLSLECRLVPIFFGVTPEDVRKKYPLISDVLGVKASSGIGAIVRKLLGKESGEDNLVLQSNLKQSEEDNGTGLTIILNAVSLLEHNLPQPYQVICELINNRNDDERIRLSIEETNKLCFGIRDLKGREVRVSTKLKIGKEYDFWIFASYNRVRNTLRLVINGETANEFFSQKLTLSPSLVNNNTLTIGASIEMEYPCSFAIAGFATYSREIDLSECRQWIESKKSYEKKLIFDR